MPENPTERAGLYYASRGWPVFPITAKEKAPPLVKWQSEATVDSKVIREWWGQMPDANIGIAVGAGGMLVLDIDGRDDGEDTLHELTDRYGALPHTPEAHTGAGRHVFFSLPSGCHVRNSAGKLGRGLDIRAEGGYVVAPPSVHPNGKTYVWEVSSKPSQTPLAPVPEWLLSLLTMAEAQVTPAPNGNGAHINAGGRNASLTSLAGTMRKRGMTLDSIEAALLLENRLRCAPPLPEKEVQAIAHSIARYAPETLPETAAKKMLDAPAVAGEFIELLHNLEGRSIPTYIAPLDHCVGGLERQTLTVLGARPSMGKTSLAWQIARNVAASGKGVCFFSLEMSAASLWARAACGMSAIRWRDVRAGQVTPDQLCQIETNSQILAERYGQTLRVSDGGFTSAAIWQTCAYHAPDLVVVDHVRLVKDRNESEIKRLGSITESLKDLSKVMNCAVLCLVQLSRNLEKRDNKRPELSDIRDSGEIEENADLVLMLYRADYYDDRPTAQSETEVLVRKFRDDVLSQKATLSYDLARQWFDGKGPR